MRGVWRENLQIGHCSNLWWNAHKMAPVEYEMAHARELGNCRREGHNLTSFFPSQLTHWSEFCSTICSGLFYKFKEVLPAIARRILSLGMEENLRDSWPIILIETITTRALVHWHLSLPKRMAMLSEMLYGQ